MKIAVDARELTGKPTGVGRYLSELIAAWSEGHDAGRHDWQFYAHRAPTVPASFPSSVEVVPGGGGTHWEQWSLARALAKDPPDVLFAPAYTAPLTAACPTMLTVHDVSFAAHPEWFSRREGTRRRVLTAWSARRARVVVTDSAFSRDEIVRYLGIPAQKVRVVPLGMTRAPAMPTGNGGPTEHGPIEGREPIILFVGSIFRRRHVDRLIAAFVDSVAYRVPQSRLEIVGENRTYPPMDPFQAMATCPPAIRNRVTLRSYVDEATLHDLYRRAMVFAFPSDYEGFGLTPLEALAAGVPSVVLDTPIAREVYGAAARFVPQDLSNHGALADALTSLLTDAASRREILRHADALLARYDWHRTAAATLAALEEAAGA
ncbi:MAG: glycosyltransferase family 4 protein [Vicinamibacterales bacterium]